VQPIIDTHQHLWNLDLFPLDWHKEAPYDQLARNFLLEDYAAASEGCNIVKTIYMEVDVRSAQQGMEAEYVLKICRRGDTLMAGAVIGGRPAAADFGEYISRFGDDPHVKGVRQGLHGLSCDACLQEDFIRGVQMLGDRGLSFDVEAPSEQLEITGRFCDACPDTQIILDHCAHPEFESDDLSAWQQQVADVARRDNVVIKISGILAHANSQVWEVEKLAPPINFLLDTFGSDRVIFGSDWPVVTINGTFKRWVDALKEIMAGRPDEEQRKLFHDNAVQVYGL